MEYSLKDALNLEGVPSERTVRRDTKNGKLTVKKNKQNHIRIDAQELNRVYDVKSSSNGQGDANGMATKTDTPRHDTDNGSAKNAINNNPLITVLKAQVEDLKADRDAWKIQAEKKDEQIAEKDSQIKMYALLPAPEPEQAANDSQMHDVTPRENRKSNKRRVGELALVGCIALLFFGVMFIKYTHTGQITLAAMTGKLHTDIEPAAGSPEEGAQLPFNSLEEDASKN